MEECEDGYKSEVKKGIGNDNKSQPKGRAKEEIEVC